MNWHTSIKQFMIWVVAIPQNVFFSIIETTPSAVSAKYVL